MKKRDRNKKKRKDKKGTKRTTIRGRKTLRPVVATSETKEDQGKNTLSYADKGLFPS